MASTFPTALDTIPDAPTTPALGGSTPKHSEMHDLLRDAVVAVETRVGITGSTDPASLSYRVSADGEGAALAALAAKTTPVDADLVGLSDSAAGGVLKKLSWSSIKEALQSVFATLAGTTGGQTLTGGTAASETLTLRSTAHATKGKILFGTSAYDEANNRLGIGINSPDFPLDVNGAACVNASGFQMRNAADVATWRISGGGTGAENFYISAFTPSERYLFAIDRTGDMGYGSYITVLRTGAVIRPNTDAAMNDRVSLRVYGGSGITKDIQQWLNTSGSILGIVDYLGKVGFGVTAASAKLHVVDTSEQQRIGYDLTNYLGITVSSTGAVTYSATGGQYIFKGIQSTATLGSELVTNGAFTTNLSGWTDSGSSWSWSAGSALHTAGSASTLSQNITVTSGNTYYIELTITGRTAGTISVSVGSVSMVDTGSTTTFGSNTTYKKTLVAAASGAVALTLTPTSTFDGAIDTISVKNVTLGSAKAVNVIQNSDGTTGFEIRSGGIGLANAIAGGGAGRSIISSTGCAAFGYYTLQALTTGVNNSGFGYYALGACTVASNNSAFGYNASYNLTSGSNNSGFGNRSLYSATTGGNNCALGYSALEGNTSGANNVGIGYVSLFSQATGANNVAIGSYAGRYIADGATSLTVADNSTFIGYNARPLANSQTNQNVIGYNSIGLGSNTSVIGNSATVTFKAFGTPILTPAASSVPTVNGELTVEATSNTQLTFRLKGSDGTVRSASLTLS